ncbi:predicted protein [Thalassiosira pseudonana CCMP1335]|uniref:FAD dependent oxidoreductase domain-containing protein n=1 Tax=Thalassiosira pseudonana TaxID=35128 RepID=B8BWJ1_THAPS|nr:predicted protein [Thalassiosira pseudonana CCMP1335]EED94040.1 predicted protein [Thalassiosira pseudonana CCMP1335]
MVHIYDTVIIGGGVVGLSILRTSLLQGYNAILLERNPHLLNGASGRNSGVICTGVDAPSGSLERALIRDSISRVREFCEEFNIPMRECGSVVCMWPWDEEEECGGEDSDEEEKKNETTSSIRDNDSRSDMSLCHERLRHVLHESHIAGDTDASYLDSQTISTLEPALSSQCRGAVHIPGEIVVDPWLFPLAYATHARELAKRRKHEFDDVIQTGREVDLSQSSFDRMTGLWSIVTRQSDCNDGKDTVVITARSVINAAGIDSDIVQLSASSVNTETRQSECIVPPPDFEARPRRGQYIVYSAPSDDTNQDTVQSATAQWKVPRTVPIRPIQPVPTDRTKGIFVYSSLYDQIVAGPTALDQSSRTDDTLDENVAKTLAHHASRVLGRQMGSSSVQTDPDFDRNIVGEYVGVRPGSSKRDYQIQLHCFSKFITVGGIRSTGLTASLGIGRHVVQCLLSTIVPTPVVVGGEEACKSLPPTPLPKVYELVEQYHYRGDGAVEVGGHVYKVTHPLTRIGWNARTGIANVGK